MNEEPSGMEDPGLLDDSCHTPTTSHLADGLAIARYRVLGGIGDFQFHAVGNAALLGQNVKPRVVIEFLKRRNRQGDARNRTHLRHAPKLQHLDAVTFTQMLDHCRWDRNARDGRSGEFVEIASESIHMLQQVRPDGGYRASKSGRSLLLPLVLACCVLCLPYGKAAAAAKITSAHVIGSSNAALLVDIRFDDDDPGDNLLVAAELRTRDGMQVSPISSADVPSSGKHRATRALILLPAQPLAADNLLFLELVSADGGAMFGCVALPLKDVMPKNSAPIDLGSLSERQHQILKVQLIPELPKNYSSAFEVDFCAARFDVIESFLRRLDEQAVREWGGSFADINFEARFEALLSGPERQTHLATIKKWRLANPDSESAVFAESIGFSMAGRRIRGRRDSPTTDPLAVTLASNSFQKAEETLTSSSKVASNSPLYYKLLIEAMGENGRESLAIEKIFDQGVAKFPNDRDIYVAMAVELAHRPARDRWEEVERIANLSESKSLDPDAGGNYASVYVAVDNALPTPFSALHDTRVNWKHLRASFERLVADYPSGPNINEFASFACQADDKEAFVNLAPSLRSSLMPIYWHTAYSPDLCAKHFHVAPVNAW